MFFKDNIYKRIYKKIKEYDKIVIARHVGADPDALASSIALRDVIINTFPDKKVYTIGFPASRFKYIGILDKLPEKVDDALLIVTDTPDYKRIDGANPRDFAYSIKIDHHPFVEKTCDLEWIDDKASSASQMIIELIFNTKLVMTKEAAEKLYIGVVADTNRFLFYYTTPKTFGIIARLIADTNIDITGLYESLYMRSLKEKKFQSYIVDNFKVSENGLAYVLVEDEALSKYDVDAATARNMVSEFNYIDEILVWAIFTVDKQNNNIRGSIRSRGPIINEVASKYNGGGHIYASGARVANSEELEKLVADLDKECFDYKAKEKQD